MDGPVSLDRPVVMYGMCRRMLATKTLHEDSFSFFLALVQCCLGLAANLLRFISQRLSPSMLKKLNPMDRKTAIFECEFFALFCAFLTWGDIIGGSAVFYTDNNVLRALISCNTNNVVGRGILIAVVCTSSSRFQLVGWTIEVRFEACFEAWCVA